MFELDSSYPLAQQFFSALSRPAIGLPHGFDVPVGIRSAVDLFVGYLLLDALTGNTDRHHENWALIRALEDQLVLAPSYDHASSLGRDLSEQQRQTRLATRDTHADVEAYARRARSAIYQHVQDARPMDTLSVFAEAAARRPEAARAWRLRLHDVPDEALESIVRRVPDQAMSTSARRFVARFLGYTRRRILELDV